MQTNLPLINSEYGAVSAGGGDRDISWGLRDLTTQLRRHPKIQGFVYTELDRHRVGTQRTGQLRPHSQGLWLRHLAARYAAQRTARCRLHWLRRTAGDRRQTRRDDHRTDLRQPFLRPHRIRPRCGGGSAATIQRPISGPSSSRQTSRSHGAIRCRRSETTRRSSSLTIHSSVLSLLTLRDEQNHRIAANFVNLVVKPAGPLPRIQRRGPNAAIVRFSPKDFARAGMDRSDGRSGRPARSMAEARAIFEYRLRSRRRSPRLTPNRFITCSRRARRPSASGSTGPHA